MNHVKRSLHLLIEDAERLLEQVSDDAGEEVAAARKRLQQSVESARARMRESRARAQGACHAFDRHARQNPMAAVACGVTIGLLAGWILGTHHR